MGTIKKNNKTDIAINLYTLKKLSLQRLIWKGGAQGRTRTDTRLPLLDFESSASTSFTTWAYKKRNYTFLSL